MSKRAIGTGTYTQVIAIDDPGCGGANHKYEIVLNGNRNQIVGEVNFQNGPIIDSGVNGVANEDLIEIVIDRILGFQSGNYACRENAIALTKLQEALMWLNKRTNDRIVRGVEGTSIV